VKQTRIGIIFTVLGAVMLVIPLIITITENSIRIFVPMIGLLLLLFGFPIILSSKKNKNIET
jgi:4-hydroxybenzoate polyprenyltransferase